MVGINWGDMVRAGGGMAGAVNGFAGSRPVLMAAESLVSQPSFSSAVSAYTTKRLPSLDWAQGW